MVRALVPRVQKGQRSVLLPGATLAEPWEFWSLGREPHCLQIYQKPKENRAGRADVFALPVQQVYAAPLWIQETDAKQFSQVIALQLEARGLQSRGQAPVFQWSAVAQEVTRTLVLVAVLPAVLSSDVETEVFASFDLSARCYPLPADALILWMEQDRLVLAATRGDRLAYFQALSDATLSARTLQDLTCIWTSLQMQEVVGELKRVVLWVELTAAELAGLKTALAAPVVQETRPAPGLPPESWNLTPSRVHEVQRSRVTRRWQGRGAILAFVLLLFVAGLLFGRLIMTSVEISHLKQWQAAHAQTLRLIRQTQLAWTDLAPVVDEKTYALELLLHVSESLPADQVHLTLFEAEHGHLLLKAEAKNLTAAFQFQDQLKKNPHLAGYTWEMAQPHALANDVTQLQIEGTYASHP